MLRRLIITSLIVFIYGFSYSLNEVQFLWSGALTPNSIRVNAKLANNSDSVRLVVSQNPDLSNAIFSEFFIANNDNNRVASLFIENLSSDAKYYYAIESDGEIDNSSEDIGTFTTPKPGAFSYSFVAGSCTINPNHPVFTAMKNHSPLFYINSGDFHYADPNSTDVNIHRIPYETTITGNNADLLKNTPTAYVWDDHDFSGNDSEASSIGKGSARRAYREYVPHYTLPAGEGNAPIYHSFIIGRVRYILTDLRSEREPATLMGSTQKTWFKNELLSAKNNNQFIVWVSSASYAGSIPDNWGGYSTERTELADFFKENKIENMMILCGDAHMLAIDNGSSNDFSSGINTEYKYPIFQAAAINHIGSFKGGSYSEGMYLNPNINTGQFGLVKIKDGGTDEICLELEGYRVESTGKKTLLTSYSFCRKIGDLPPIKVYPNPTKGNFTIEIYEIDKEADCVVRLYDLKGKVILQNTLHVTKGQSKIPVILDKKLAPGIYIVNFKYDNRNFNTKLAISE